MIKDILISDSDCSIKIINKNDNLSLIELIKSYNPTNYSRDSIYFWLSNIEKYLDASGSALFKRNQEFYVNTQMPKKLLTRVGAISKYLDKLFNYFSNGNKVIDCSEDFLGCTEGLKNVYAISIQAHKENGSGILILKNTSLNQSQILEKLDEIEFTYQHILRLASNDENEIEKNALTDNLPGFVTKFIVSDKDHYLRLIDSDNQFFNFFGLVNQNLNDINYMSYISQDNLEIIKSQSNNIRAKKPINFDVRIKNLEDELIWIRVRGSCIGEHEGLPLYLGVFLDVTEEKNLQIQLQEEKLRYSIALESSFDDIIFEYDIEKDIYKEYGTQISMTNIYHRPKTIENYIKTLKDNNKDNGIDTWISFLLGKDKNDFDIKREVYKSGETTEYWLNVKGKVLEVNSIPTKVYGRLRNITNKKQIEYIQSQENLKDEITNLNKLSHGMDLINEYIENKDSSEICSVLVIDIDNFDIVNDNFGYIFGNVILAEFAEIIRGNVDNKHIFIRHSSDNFIILLKDTKDKEALKIGKLICSKIRHIYVGEDIHLTCSIGVSSSNTVACSSEELIKSSDCALMHVKNCGRGFAAYYFDVADEIKDSFYNNHLGREEQQIKVNANLNDIQAFTLEVLQKSKNLRDGIHITLAQIGKQLGLKRIGVYELDTSNQHISINHEWLKSQHTVKNKIISVREKDFKNLLEIFEQKNNFVVIDTTTKFTDRIKDILMIHNNQTLIFSQSVVNKNIIIIIYEHHDELYKWNDQQKNRLHSVSCIISTYLEKEQNNYLCQSKNEFLSKMSHEIRTPLHGIIGMVKIAQNISNDPAKLKQSLEKVNMSARYLLSLVNNVLDMSRIESGKMKICNETFDLDVFANDIYDLMKVQADEKNIRFNIIKKINNKIFLGDNLRLNQVLINIIGNAIKFTPKKGYVTLLIDETYQDFDYSKIKFVIKDTGIGINKDNIKRIFNTFEQEKSTTARKYGGTGLGLAISNNLVKLMGSNIEVISEEGKGSEFFFTLTLNKDKGFQYDLASDRIKDIDFNQIYNFKGKKILLVEDNELNSEIAQTILEEVGFDVELAEDGKKAVDIFIRKKPNYFNVVLMDIRMPNMDGIKATRKIRTLGKSDSLTIPIIAMSANAFDEDVKHSLECGMNSYLIKPIDVNILYKELNRVINHEHKEIGFARTYNR